MTYNGYILYEQCRIGTATPQTLSTAERRSIREGLCEMETPSLITVTYYVMKMCQRIADLHLNLERLLLDYSS